MSITRELEKLNDMKAVAQASCEMTERSNLAEIELDQSPSSAKHSASQSVPTHIKTAIRR